MGKNNLERVVWFDEGMAQYFSDEMDALLDDERFKNWYIRLKEKTKVIPTNLNELDHEDAFSNENYNGYSLSYMCVKYLIETFGIAEFKKIISDIPRIKEYGKNLLNEVSTYYDNKFGLTDNKQKVSIK